MIERVEMVWVDTHTHAHTHTHLGLRRHKLQFNSDLTYLFTYLFTKTESGLPVVQNRLILSQLTTVHRTTCYASAHGNIL